MLLKEVIAVYCETHTIINKLREKRAQFLDVISMLCRNLCALKGQGKWHCTMTLSSLALYVTWIFCEP